MDFDASNELKEYLDINETLIWSGQPQKGIVFRTSDIILIPVSIVWCGFSIFWVTMAARHSFFFVLYGIPFVLAGLVFVFGRFFIDAKLRAGTYYGFTADRIIIKSGIFKKTIKSLNIKTLPHIEYVERSDKSGTISIGPKNSMVMFSGMGDWGHGIKATPTMELIQDVRQVYNKIIALQQAK